MLKYITLGLGLLCGFLAFLLYIREPKIVREVRTYEKKVIEKVYIKTNSTITGGVTATVLPNGTTTVSGSNLSIQTNTVTQTITQTVEKEKQVLVYKKPDWTFGVVYQHLNDHPDLIQVNIGRRIIFDLYVSVGYAILVNPNVFSSPTYSANLENFSVGLQYSF